MKSQTKRTLVLLVPLSFVALLLVREIGVIDWTLFSSGTQTQQNAKLNTAFDPNNPGGYFLELRYKNGFFVRHQHDDGRRKVTGVLETDYSGLYWTPFYKSFTLRYTLSLDSPDGSMRGNIDGECRVKITGLCSARGAREHARQRVQHDLLQYLTRQLRDPQ